MSTETSSPVHTIASVVGLPQRGGRKGHIPMHCGHTVQEVRAALKHGAHAGQILEMIPWGGHGSAFVVDRSIREPSSSSTQRVRALIDGRCDIVVAVVYYGDIGEAVGFAQGAWAFAADRVQFGTRAVERRERRMERRAAVLAVPPAARESLRQVLLAQDRDALRESSAQRSADEKASAERVRAWWRGLSDADRGWAMQSSCATHPDGWRFADGQEGGRVSFSNDDDPSGDRVWHGAGRAIAEVQDAERESRRDERWDALADSVRVRGGDA